MRTLLLLLALTACAPTGLHKPRMGTQRPQTTVVVTNYNWTDARVYILDGYEGPNGGGRRLWIGYVGAMNDISRDRRLFHNRVAFEVRFLADTGPAYITYPVSIRPGDIIELTIGITIEMSRITVVGR